MENLTPTRAVDRVADQVHEIRPQHGLAAADVHVEDLEVDQLVDDVARFGGRQLARVTPARRAQAMHAGQVAGVGQLPGQADGCVETPAELILQGQRSGVSGHRSPPNRPGGAGRARTALRCSSGTIATMASAAVSYSPSDGDQFHQEAGLEEDETPVAVVVGQRAEGLVTQRDLGMQPPGLIQGERSGRPRLGDAQ